MVDAALARSPLDDPWSAEGGASGPRKGPRDIRALGRKIAKEALNDQ
jgi:hypothetical protein